MLKPLILIFFVPVLLFGQISPGELTKAHSSLEGISNCTKCHVLGEQVYNSKCLDCHSEINALINSGRGYHASSEVKGKNCWSCHSEHHGRNFQIIRFDEKNFDHNKTGYILEGAHTKPACKDCHKSSNIKDAKLKQKSKTFLGLSIDCVSCHKDEHRGTLGNKCLDCHGQEQFKGAEKFSHDNAAFRLTGKHISVECSKCHKQETASGNTFIRFKPVGFSSCETCHRDPHEKRFGTDCQKCHTTAGFKILKEGSFNHDATKFPLTGKHIRIACNDCHKGSTKRITAFEKCTDCHKDEHNRQFVTNGILDDCSKCHNTSGFSPSQFGIADHNKGTFALSGSHLALPCFSCHKKTDTWLFKPVATACISCHNNIHGGELTEEFMPGKECRTCHTVERWQNVNFDHNKTAFSLAGKHASAGCKDCHYSTKEIAEGTYVFKSSVQKCTACHEDRHQGQFAERGETGCTGCHGYTDWKALKFNHSQTNFALTGAHAKLPCSECHKPAGGEDNSYIQYKMTDFKCISCHK